MITHFYNFLSNNCLAHYEILVFSLSLAISLISGKLFLTFLQKYTQSRVRKFTPETHTHKNNTPTMGGLFILLSSLVTTFQMMRGINETLMILTLTLLLFGAIGFYDDWCKINKTGGISSSVKFILQLCSSILVLSLWVYYKNPSLTLPLPFISPNSYSYLGHFWILWGAFVMVGTSNAVNLTDGLDGLATRSLIPNFILVSILATALLSSYPVLSTELICFAIALAGSLCGFLWYNRRPAKVFMGDIGSLPLGAVLALFFLILKKEYLLIFSGILFVLETVSVMIQVYGYKFLHKRIFKMAPFHHHLELCGWSESKIVSILSLITLFGCCIAWKIS